MITLRRSDGSAVAKHRVIALNRVYRIVAARHPDQLTVVDIEPAVRQSHAQRWDSVHWTAHGADVLARIVVPLIARAASETTVASRPSRES